MANQTFDAAYEFCHALSINNGQNIEVKNCKFQSFRGDGVLFGDTFLSSPNLRMTSNVSVHDNEFYKIYREGAMFCAVNGGSFYSNYLHGDGFFVGGVDIERHTVNETVLNVSVYSNTFDFRDGFGSPERGGPVVKYRRAVTIGFFYTGYTNNTVDGRAAGHKVYGNTIYQGQIDCWGHTNVSITNNTITNTYENIEGVRWVTAPAINISDPGSTAGLSNVIVTGNKITSAMDGNGILFNNYTGVTASSNTINATKRDGINIYNSSGVFNANIIQNIGSPSYKVSGIVINGKCSGLVVSNNKVSDTNVGTSRGINYAIAIQSKLEGTVPPTIQSNTATNLLNGVVSEYYEQLGYVLLSGNLSL
ncbi:right-handed parallel beta-helix repeat-containing protein [Mucilaginibacter antarcticus]